MSKAEILTPRQTEYLQSVRQKSLIDAREQEAIEQFLKKCADETRLGFSRHKRVRFMCDHESGPYFIGICHSLSSTGKDEASQVIKTALLEKGWKITVVRYYYGAYQVRLRQAAQEPPHA